MHTNPTAGPAEGQPDPQTVEEPRNAALLHMDQLAHAAEQHMVLVLGVPERLLPSALEGNPLQVLSIAVRRAVLRRMRIRDRLKVAAETLAGQAQAVIELVAGARPLPDGHPGRCPVSLSDAARVTELATQLAELDLRLNDEADTLRATARSYSRAHVRAAAAAAGLPGVEERARQRGLGPE